MHLRWIRGVSLALAAAVCATGLVATSAQAKPSPKPGRPCPTVGAEVTQGRWVFTCTLKNGKKVWVRTPRPAAKPTWQIVAEELAARGDARRSSPPATAFDFRASPTIPATTLSTARAAVTWSYETWFDVAPLNGFPVLIVDENSERWYMEQSASFPGDNCARHWWDKTKPNSMTISGAVCFGPSSDWGYMVLLLGSAAGERAPWLYIHESVHVAQWSIVGNLSMNRMECWLGEGMAELYTGALSFIRKGGGVDAFDVASYRRMAVFNLRRIAPSPSEVRSAAYWLDVIRTSEDRSQERCWGTGLGYSLGYLVTEKLVADFGEGKLFEWMRLTRETGDSEDSFATVFGIDQDAWYEQSAAPYVAKEAALILG